MTLCDLCRNAARRTVPAYWGPELCPGCCHRTAATNDAKRRWPALPWKGWPE